ncbi:hypothetical protein AA16373_1618 [Komagataeibacter swingsii DSM 16373]|nr:hypothetical protein AA16373_1618 [Komagataeibacter swingsii DSM 16373]
MDTARRTITSAAQNGRVRQLARHMRDMAAHKTTGTCNKYFHGIKNMQPECWRPCFNTAKRV